MKKFSKLLILMLLVVAAVTIFSVAALAADSSSQALTPQTISSSKGYHAVAKDGSFESFDVGAALSNSASKHGKWYVAQADNGNKYAVSEYESGTGEAYENLDIMTTTSRGTYALQKYPAFAFDFDIMSNTGEYNYASVRPDLYATAKNDRIVQMGGVSINTIGLPKTVNEWNHVSMIVIYQGKGVFNHYFYVNGTLTVEYQTDWSKNSNWLTRVDENGDLVATNVLVNVVSIYPPRGAEKIYYDNMTFTYFPEQYKVDDIASYFYNDKYVFPYTFTEAKIGDAVYDDVNKAVAAATEGQTVKLTQNADTKLLINNNIFIDTNVYDENNNPTGSFYTYEYETTKGFVPTETAAGSGIFSFAKSPNAIDVIWDPACEGECSCFAEYGGHNLTAESVFILGQVPSYSTNIPTFAFDYSNSTLKKFIGWSYENDSTVDTLVAITESDVSTGALKLYPVYATYTCDIEVISGASSTYYAVGEDFAAIVEAAPADATVKLLGDVYTECTTINVTKNVTIDLNGFSLKRCNVYGKVYEATESADGLVYSTDGTYTSVSSSTSFFKMKASNITFRITSSKEGGSIYLSHMDSNSWTHNGEIVKRDSVSISSGYIVHLSYADSNSGTKLVIDGDVSAYAGGLWHQDSGSLTGTSITLDGFSFYHTVNKNIIINARTNADCTITVSNSFFYTPANVKLLNMGASDVGNQAGDIVATFTNCDFFKVDASYSLTVYAEKSSSVKSVVFDNCRMFDINGGSPTAVNGCLQINGKYNANNGNGNQGVSEIAAGSGYVSVPTSISYTYTVPKTLTFAATADAVAVPNFNLGTVNKTVTYNRIISKPVSVNWVDLDGNTTTTTEYPGASVAGPEIIVDLENDNYRNLVAQWVDAKENGKLIPSVLAFDLDTKKIDFETTEYTFYAVTEFNGSSKYVGAVQGAMLNLTYYGHFAYYIYVPVQEGVTLTQLGDYGPSGISVKLIDGVEYWCANTGWMGPANAINAKTATVKYKIDGVTYTRTMSVNAMLYSAILLNDPATAEVEKKAVISLMAYSEEAYKNLAEGNVLADDVAAKFNTFFDTYTEGVRPSAADFESEKITVNEDAIDGLIKSMNFRIYGSENRLSFVVTLTKEAVDLGYSIQVFGVSSSINKASTPNADGSVDYYTNNNGLIGGIMHSSYTINVLDSSGKIVTRDLDKNPETPDVAATTHYNLATYCAATGDKLSIALFTFGKDATEARKYLLPK